MRFLSIQIRLLSTVIISSYVPDNNLTGTLGYIPASSILGLFAAKYISKEKLEDAHNNSNFYNWFLRNDIIFTNAYISQKEEYKEIDMLPTPMCIKKQKKDEDKIINILIKDIYEQPVSFSTYSYIYGSSIKAKEPEKIINFHHQRDRLSGHTQDDGMFNYEALAPGQVFKGKIYGDASALADFKAAFSEEFSARLGKSKNTEYGKVRIALSEIIDEDTAITNHDIEGKDFALLTFISPCILLNKNGFSDPSAANLKNYLEDIWGKGSIKIDNCVAKAGTVENYISVWGMKKPSENALTAGSTFKLSFKMPAGNIKKGLEKILEEGIGERRGEGFGRVKINMAMSEEYTKRDIAASLEKPKTPVPEGAKTIFKHIIKNMLKQQIEHEAYKDTCDLDNLPSNSLLGKLGLMAANMDKEKFIKEIEQFRSKAKEQLHDCSKGNKKLYDYIKEYNTDEAVRNILDDIIYKDYAELAEYAGYESEKDNALLKELWKIYFVSLFRNMRQKNREISLKGGIS